MKRTLTSIPVEQETPCQLFGGVSPQTWRWLHLEGRVECPFLEHYLPDVPDDPAFEAQTVGSSGKAMLAEGWQIYVLFKECYERYAGPLRRSIRVLDFGCGFGRVCRFFLKDVAPSNLFGIDVNETRLAACDKRWAQFRRCDPLPPADLDSASFDLIFAFSVFSHLSEEAHRLWLEEFERMLRSGGVLILTTFPRDVLGHRSDGLPLEQSAWDRSAREYDAGEFCFRRLEGIDNPHYGDAFIPETYARRHWSQHFEVREYFEASEHAQNVIVCMKP